MFDHITGKSLVGFGQGQADIGEIVRPRDDLGRFTAKTGLPGMGEKGCNPCFISFFMGYGKKLGEPPGFCQIPVVFVRRRRIGRFGGLFFRGASRGRGATQKIKNSHRISFHARLSPPERGRFPNRRLFSMN
jgi:hypothetical protein